MHGPLTFYLNGSGDLRTVYVQYYASDDRVQMSAGLKVDKKKFEAGKLPKDQAAYLRRLQTVIDNYEANTRQAGEKTTAAAVRTLILEATGRKAPAKRNSGNTFLTYFSEYLDEVERGDILNDGKRYSPSFIKGASAALGHIRGSNIAHIPVTLITEQDLQKFAAGLTAKGLAKNSVATYLDPICSFLNNGRRSGRHKGQRLEAKAFRVNREDIDHAVYLDEADQAAIKALPYEGEQAQWRDAALFGCQVGMRHSDLIKLTPKHRQGDLVNINTTKTSTPVWVPLNAMARELWDKYQGQFNVPPKDPFLAFFKQMGQDAGLDKEVLFVRTEGGKKVERWVKKWELLGTHTMRRSAATNGYLNGVDIVFLMQMTGHKTLRQFMKYIRLTAEDAARRMQSHPYFK